MFTKSNKEPQTSHTRKHTRAPHLWFYSTPPLWWTLGHRRRDVTVSPTNIVGNGDQMAANHLTTFFFFFWGASTHVHLSDETAEDAKPKWPPPFVYKSHYPLQFTVSALSNYTAGVQVPRLVYVLPHSGAYHRSPWRSLLLRLAISQERRK